MKTTKKRELLNLLHTLMDTLPDFIYVKDAKSRFLLANDAVVRSMGLKTLDDLIGKTDFDFHPPELAKQYYADEQALLTSGQPLINREEPVKDQETGEIRWFLSTKIPFRNSQGNIGGFVGINRDITKRKQAEEELAQRMKERITELETLQHIMNRVMSIAQQLGNASEEMTQISAQMAAEAEQFSRQAFIVSSNSQQISQHVSDVSVAIEESATNIREISRTVTNVAEITTNAVNIANEANTAITSLKNHSQEIGKISKVITNVAQQTKFLALNATIEAAQAGEAGQGFKVVADEVKDLAREASLSAEDITNKIITVQADSEDTAHAIAEVVKIINQVSELSDNIAAAISEQTQTTNEISRTVADSARGSDEITRTIGEIATVTQNSAKRAVSVQHEAQELSLLAEQLHQLVEHLRVETDAENT